MSTITPGKSARQMIHMKCQVLFSLKNNDTISKFVCCSYDWHCNG